MRLIRQHRKQNGFFGIHIDSQLRRSGNPRLQHSSQPFHHVAIVRAAARDDHFLGCGIFSDRQGDGPNSQLGCGCDIDAGSFDEFSAELLPSARFWRLATIIRVLIQQPFEQCPIHLTRARPLTIPVKGRRKRIHHHVPRPGIECYYILHPRLRRNNSDVRDASDIERDSRDRRMPKQLIVEKRNQRRALSAGGHVAGPEIGDGLDARPLGDDGCLANLHCAGNLASQELHRLALVENRLTVRADQFDGLERYAGLPHRLRK